MQLIESILRASNTPPCAVIDNDYNVVYIHGKVSHFLELPEGQMTLSILEMAKPGLNTPLVATIRKALINKQEIEQKDIIITQNGRKLSLNLCVKPLLEAGASRHLMLVIFNETTDSLTSSKDPKEAQTESSQGKTAPELEQELNYTRQTLQSTIEELETSNEELKSTNEELQSTNEELQSTNEELETSREELQSLNEESITVNTELQNRVDELSQSNDDMKNLLDSTEIATIFLDNELCIRRFTPKATEIIPLANSDSGRPLSHLASNLIDTDLSKHARQVLTDLVTIEQEVKSKDDHFYLLRIRPYRTVNNVIDGIVMTFDDITQRVNAEISLKQNEQLLTLAFQATNDAVWNWDLKNAKVTWNSGYDKVYGEMSGTDEEALEWRMNHIHPDDRERVIESIQSAIKSESDRWIAKFRYRRTDNSYVSVIDRAYITRDANANATHIIGAMLDISQFKET